jgi:tetratricopeptide (TPR) repeat protein
MRRFLFFGFGVVLITLLSIAPAGVSVAFDLELPNDDDRWIKVESPNFTVFSNADERIAQETAMRFEQLWAVLVRDLQGLHPVSPVVTNIYVFDYFSDVYPAYGPFAKGKPKRSGGFFLEGRAANYAAIVERDYRYPSHSGIYHDYVHTVLQAIYPKLPLWLEEGLAEYYSVFRIEEGRAQVGSRIDRHIAWLRNKPLIPLPELLSVDRDSPEYREESRVGIFYAQSWLLTHMLVTERPEGRAQAARFAELLREGHDRDTAFTKAFQTTFEELEAQFKKYVRSRSYHYTVFPVSRKIIRNTTMSDMTRPEVLFRLGDLAVNGDAARHHFAAAHFEAAVALDEGSGSAVAGLGLLDEIAGRDDAALGRYERAVELTPDDYRINLLLGCALARECAGETNRDECADRLRRARHHLRRAGELQPGLVDPWAELGATYIAQIDNVQPGIDALEHAMELQPKRADVGLNLTTLYVAQGAAVRADTVVERMRAAGVGAQTLRRAKEISDRLNPEVTCGRGSSDGRQVEWGGGGASP